MRQVSLGLLVILCFCFPIPVNAQAPTDNYIRQLMELGYDDIKINQTFLGRYRILADRDGVTRELVVARNGQLLFDYLNIAEREPSNGLKKTTDDRDGASTFAGEPETTLDSGMIPAIAPNAGDPPTPSFPTTIPTQ